MLRETVLSAKPIVEKINKADSQIGALEGGIKYGDNKLSFLGSTSRQYGLEIDFTMSFSDLKTLLMPKIELVRTNAITELEALFPVADAPEGVETALDYYQMSLELYNKLISLEKMNEQLVNCNDYSNNGIIFKGVTPTGSYGSVNVTNLSIAVAPTDVLNFIKTEVVEILGVTTTAFEDL